MDPEFKILEIFPGENCKSDIQKKNKKKKKKKKRVHSTWLFIRFAILEENSSCVYKLSVY